MMSMLFNSIKGVADMSIASSKIRALGEQQDNIAAAANANAAAAASSLTQEGINAATERGRQTAVKASSQRVSFLNAGLTMDGTPQAAVGNTINLGSADVAQIGANYATRATNSVNDILGRARAQNIELANRAQGIATDSKMSLLKSVGGDVMQAYSSGLFSSTPQVPASSSSGFGTTNLSTQMEFGGMGS